MKLLGSMLLVQMLRFRCTVVVKALQQKVKLVIWIRLAWWRTHSPWRFSRKMSIIHRIKRCLILILYLDVQWEMHKFWVFFFAVQSVWHSDHKVLEQNWKPLGSLPLILMKFTTLTPHWYELKIIKARVANIEIRKQQMYIQKVKRTFLGVSSGLQYFCIDFCFNSTGHHNIRDLKRELLAHAKKVSDNFSIKKSIFQ